MFRRKMYDRGYIYILIAIICLIIFFMGFRIINNTGEKGNINGQDNYTTERIDKTDKTEETKKNTEESVIVFNDLEKIESVDISNDINRNNTDNNFKINTDNFFLKILINSNAYMQVAFQQSNLSSVKLGIHNLFLENITESITFEAYLKSQLPAILRFVETSAETAEVSSSNYKISDDKNDVPIMEDIIFVEDPAESEKGETIEDDESVEISEEKNIIQAPNSIKLEYENPCILIYHTHGTEAYLPIKENQYHTSERQYNVLKIGEIIGSILSEKGYKLRHIDIYHDIPSYSESYVRSLATIRRIMKEQRDIKIVFDIHRDGVDENASYYEKALKESKVNINGKDVATFSLVIGPENPNKDKLIEFAKYIKAVSDSLYPGLCKGIIMKPYGKFNEFVCDHYALVEVGSNLNTIDEAKESAKLIGEVLSKVIEGIKK